jgi:CO dehydrogenase maturation factor
MALTIAVSGKGGSGKTTLSAMIIRHLMERAGRGVLAVDADPNACLGLALGVQAEKTVADLREETLGGKLPGADTDRERAFELAIHHALVEAKGFDLLVMGQPEGPKCYCAVNHLLRRYLDEASAHYPYVVVDNEAGMEHLSRRTTNAVTHLIVVAEPNPMGVTTARRILGLAQRLPITVQHRHVLWNKVAGPAAAPAGTDDLPTLGCVPADPQVIDAAGRGATVFQLPPTSAAFMAVGSLLTGPLGVLPAK